MRNALRATLWESPWNLTMEDSLSACGYGRLGLGVILEAVKRANPCLGPEFLTSSHITYFPYVWGRGS